MTDYEYNGSVSDGLVQSAKEAYKQYKSDREPIIQRVRDAERFYRSYYNRFADDIRENIDCKTPFIFSCIENSAADISSNYPVPNVLERDPAGTEAAEALSKLLPVQLEMSNFRDVFDENVKNKLKYGTAIYGVFYNSITRQIDIRSIDITDIYVDAHLADIQDSRFVFISAAVDNDLLKEQYPEFKDLFVGNTDADGIDQSFELKDRTEVLDCYYKKPDGTVHMLKLCKDYIIAATEDMDGYENGLYDHGQFPVVFDTLFHIPNSPYGFGMIDIGKDTQIQIDKLDMAITRNVLVSSKQRYFSRRNGGINVEEFTDLDRDIVHVDGDLGESVQAIQATSINTHPITHREYKKDELKEILANRDFQQGNTTGGVTAGSAIEILRETGEKRSRKITSDTYRAYKKIIYMTIELIRQFYSDERVFRVDGDMGRKDFISFDNSLLNAEQRPLEFDIDVVPQTENPYTQETQNNTLMTLWNTGFFLPQNAEAAAMLLKNMDFKGKTQLLDDMQKLMADMQQQAAQQQPQQQPQQPQQGDMVGIDLNSGQILDNFGGGM